MTPLEPRPVHVRLDLLPVADATPHETSIVIDVLRMTTTATVLAELGLAQLCVVADIERARARARAEGALLLGERDARPLPGFDGGNSPLEYSADQVAGRSAVLCTTNGAAAVEACAGAAGVVLGSLRNASAAARRALAYGTPSVRLVCAGTRGKLSLDDVVAAGAVVAALLRNAADAELDDAAMLALAAAGGGEALRSLRASSHGRTLARAGFDADVVEAARSDVSDVVLERVAGTSDRFAAAPS